MDAGPPKTKMQKRKQAPYFGILAGALPAATILITLLGWPEVDILARDIVPILSGIFVVVSFVRRERLFWGIIGVISTATYVGLHLIATP